MSDPLPPQAKPRPGARTPEGLERCRKATWKHGRRSAEAIAGQRLRGQARRIVADLDALIREAEAACVELEMGADLADAVAESQPPTCHEGGRFID
ncbi:hypothetical protein [Falsiroseomonas sp. E2-1-a20]|uniref:hypothetical protein n=1 Tax=Falsiroseomonas sp. E2-1-a20 TaxID=3239300 RepID=UPI003F38BF14